MEELEGFLMIDEAGLDMNLNLFGSMGEFPEIDELDSDFFSLFEDDGFGIHESLPIRSMNNEENQNVLLPHYSPQQQQEQQEQQRQLLLQQQHEQKQLLLQQQQQILQQQHQQQQQEEEEEVVEEDEVAIESDDKKEDGNYSKNFVSERNRRKRLNQQLFTLRSLVPNITKMDKRSILVDALAYLQNLLQQIDKEMEKNSLPSNSKCSSSLCESSTTSSLSVEDEAQPINTQEYDPYASLPAISEMDAEMLDDDRFILKIVCNKAKGGLRLVQRGIEMLGLDISCISTSELDHSHMLTTSFLCVKKKGVNVTQEKILHRMKTNATMLGLLLPPDS